MTNLMQIPRWIVLLLAIYNHCYGQAEVKQVKLKKTTGMTCGHVVKLLRLLEQRGLIVKHRDGRNCYVKLTSKGVQVCMLLHTTCNILDKCENHGCIQKEV